MATTASQLDISKITPELYTNFLLHIHSRLHSSRPFFVAVDKRGKRQASKQLLIVKTLTVLYLT